MGRNTLRYRHLTNFDLGSYVFRVTALCSISAVYKANLQYENEHCEDHRLCCNHGIRLFQTLLLIHVLTIRLDPEEKSQHWENEYRNHQEQRGY